MQVNTFWRIVFMCYWGLIEKEYLSVGQQKDNWSEQPIMNYILSEPQSHSIRNMHSTFIVRPKRHI